MGVCPCKASGLSSFEGTLHKLVGDNMVMKVGGKDNASGKAHVHAWRRVVNCLGFWTLGFGFIWIFGF